MSNEEKKLAVLYGRAQDGDRDALQTLCKTLEKYIRGYFWQKFQNNTIVDDLSQETYLRLLHSLPRIRERVKLKSFVAKVAMHVAQDYLRNKYRKKEEGLEIHYSADEDGETQLKEAASANEEDERILDHVDLLEALQALPERSREIIILKGQGYNYEEIAAEMDLSVSGVKMQVKRSMESLRLSLFDVTFFVLATTSLIECVLF